MLSWNGRIHKSRICDITEDGIIVATPKVLYYTNNELNLMKLRLSILFSRILESHYMMNDVLPYEVSFAGVKILDDLMFLVTSS